MTRREELQAISKIYKIPYKKLERIEVTEEIISILNNTKFYSQYPKDRNSPNGWMMYDFVCNHKIVYGLPFDVYSKLGYDPSWVAVGKEINVKVFTLDQKTCVLHVNGFINPLHSLIREFKLNYADQRLLIIPHVKRYLKKNTQVELRDKKLKIYLEVLDQA